MKQQYSPSKLGRLSTQAGTRSSGKRVDEWQFSPAVPHGEEGKPLGQSKTITFEVSIVRDQMGALAFKALTADIPTSRWDEPPQTDIMVLRERAESAARHEFDLHHGLVWSQWLEIQVEEGFPRPGDTQAMACVAYRTIARAEAPDGTAYSINSNGHLMVFPKPVGVDRNADIAGRHTPGHDGKSLFGLEKQDGRPATAQFTYLPDTPKNRAGLDGILNAIGEVNARLQSFLTPETIGSTLARVAAAGHLLLAAPEGERPAGQGPRRKP